MKVKEYSKIAEEDDIVEEDEVDKNDQVQAIECRKEKVDKLEFKHKG